LHPHQMGNTDASTRALWWRSLQLHLRYDCDWPCDWTSAPVLSPTPTSYALMTFSSSLPIVAKGTLASRYTGLEPALKVVDKICMSRVHFHDGEKSSELRLARGISTVRAVFTRSSMPVLVRLQKWKTFLAGCSLCTTPLQL